MVTVKPINFMDIIKRYSILFCGWISAVILLLPPDGAAAQGRKTAQLVEVSSRVTDSRGEPIASAMVQSNEGAIVAFTDASGSFTIRTRPQGNILIEAFGFNRLVIRPGENGLPPHIIMETEGLYVSDSDILERPDGGRTYQRDLSAAISKVDVEKLKLYPDLQLSNAMQGRAPGLIAISGDGGLDGNASSLYVRGLHTMGDNKQAIVVIDGIERPIDDILPEEIESIEILKDAAAKILYGPQAANGVILVTTKRGEAHKRFIRVGVEYGVQPTSRVPDFLGAYDYATLFNEARVNDGMPAFYSQAQLEGYRNSKGVNDLLYPDVDYYKEFLRSQSTFRKAVLELNGGNDIVVYAFTGGYTGSSGLESVGKRSDLNRINARGNLDLRINSFITARADVASRIEIKKWGAKDGAGIFGVISENRPNEYPFLISEADITGHDGIVVNEDGTPIFGASTNQADNLYADLLYGGNTQDRYVNTQTNMGVDFDLDQFVKGLTFSAYITFDNYSYLRQQMRKTYPTYAVDTYMDENGDLATRFLQMKTRNVSSDQNISSNSTYRYLGWRTNVGYKNTFAAVHDFSAMAAFKYTQEQYTGSTQDFKDANATLRLNYGYGKRYIAEFTMAAMGTNKFKGSNRWFFAPAVSAAWIVSNEGFMDGAANIDFLKLKASYGLLGYAGNTGYLLYSSAWSENGTYSLKPSQSNRLSVFTRWGNPDLKWERSEEYNIGVEGLFLDRRLALEADYFHEKRSEIIGLNDAGYANVVGDFKMYENLGTVVNRGIDAGVHWSGTAAGDFSYTVGANFTYTKNKLTRWPELPGTESYRTIIGRPVAGIWGLESTGLFGKDVQLSGHPNQTFGHYQTGDIAYADLNKDGVIDENDESYLGQSFPLTTWGIDVQLNYKGFGLYVQGTIHTGMKTMLSNAYYWNNGLTSYSVLALDRYHEVNNPAGTMPRLTSTEGQNNYRSSDFWLENTSFFRLKNIELSYTFDNRTGTGIARNIKVFARATNLWTISALKDLDPERPDAGLTNYPAYTTITGGISISF